MRLGSRRPEVRRSALVQTMWLASTLVGSGIVARQQHAAGRPDAAEGHHAGLGITLVGEVDGALGTGDTEGVDQVEVVFHVEVRQGRDAQIGVAALDEVDDGGQTSLLSGLQSVVGRHRVGRLPLRAEAAGPGHQHLVAGGGVEHVVGAAGVVGEVDRVSPRSSRRARRSPCRSRTAAGPPRSSPSVSVYSAATTQGGSSLPELHRRSRTNRPCWPRWCRRPRR